MDADKTPTTVEHEHQRMDNTGVDDGVETDRRTLPPDIDTAHLFPDAIAVQIGTRDLWIANGNAVKPENLAAMGLDPDFVVSVNSQPTAATTDHHPLRDGFVNQFTAFCEAVDTARDRIQSDGMVIINCAAGISRSTTVMATALAVEEDLTLGQAVNTIQQHREQARPHGKLLFTAHAYLGVVANQEDNIEATLSVVDDITDRTTASEQVHVENIVETCLAYGE